MSLASSHRYNTHLLSLASSTVTTHICCHSPAPPLQHTLMSLPSHYVQTTFPSAQCPAARNVLLQFQTILGTSLKNRPGWLNRYSDSLRSGRSGDRIPARSDIFSTRPDRPTQLSVQWVPCLSRELNHRGVALTTHTQIAPRLKKE